jgi:O-acetylhomoserine (thiol)-lyase
MNETLDFDATSTLLVHSVGNKVGPIAPTIVASAAFGYEDANEAEGIFSGNVAKPLYARMGNPTNGKLETTMATLEGGVGAIATSSGMGALSMVVTSILNSGDTMLCIGGFFGGTYALVNETLNRFGVESSFCEVDDYETLEENLKQGIKLVLVESIGNPSLRLPHLEKISTLCKAYNTLLVVDNTITPLVVQPLNIGADIVIYSSTKILSGHSAALGGVVIFREVDPKQDTLLHEKYSDLHKFVHKMGAKAFLPLFKKRALRDFGMSANAFGSFLTLLGLETLSLRTKQINQTVKEVAKLLNEGLPSDYKVNHPSLSTSKDNVIYIEHFPLGCGSMMTLECGTKERAFKLLNNLQMVIQTANIGDNRTLALHMDSTIYRDFTPKDKAFLGVTEGLIRISIGLEKTEDIIQDFLKATSTP